MKSLLDFRELAEGGAVVPGVLTRADGAGGDPTADLLLESRVVFLVHGYNVNRADGVKRLEGLADKLSSQQNAALVMTLWPGDHWLGALSYPIEWRDARDSAAQLVRFIGDTLRRGVPLSFVTHSLGARVAMDAIRTVLQMGYSVEQVCLMAPAIDDDSLSDFRVYRRATEETDRTAVLSSVEDEVLRLAYPAGDFLHTLFYSGETWGTALGYRGPKPESERNQSVPANVYHVAIPVSRGADHKDYLPEDDPANLEQESAARFADTVLSGLAAPEYV